MIINMLSEGANEMNQFKAEVAFFTAKSLLDGIEDDDGPQTMAFMGKLIEFFLTNQLARESFLVAQ